MIFKGFSTQLFSAVVFDDVAVPRPIQQVLICSVTGLSQNTPVTWIGPDNNEISSSDSSNYVVEQGNYDAGDKISTLTIKLAKVATLSLESVFKCKLKSAIYPTHSPDVEKEMTLTFLELGTSKV